MQTQTDFKWLVAVDRDTPRYWVQRLAKELQGFGAGAEIVQCGDDFRADLRKAIRRNTDARWLITSRVDSDDALDLRYIEAVQAKFNGQAFQLVSFPEGYSFSIPDRRLRRLRFVENQFLSLIEDSNPSLKTVFDENHFSFARRFPPVLIEQHSGWLQSVHGENLVNTHWGDPMDDVPTQNLDNILDRFAIKSTHTKAFNYHL